jgi:hypothetical protein
MKYQINTNLSESEINELLSIYDYMKYFYYHISNDLKTNIKSSDFKNESCWKKCMISMINKVELKTLKTYIKILENKYNIWVLNSEDWKLDINEFIFYHRFYKVYKFRILLSLGNHVASKKLIKHYTDFMYSYFEIRYRE